MSGPDRAILSETLGRIASEDSLWESFLQLCDIGPRFSGTDSEGAALGYLEGRLRGAGWAEVRRWEFDYRGWHCERCEVSLLSPPPARRLPSLPLVYSAPTPPGGIALEVVDVGRGAPEDYRRVGEALRGRAVLADAEYSFATFSLHRRHKFLPAVEAGAAAFLLANSRPGCFPVTGSTAAGGSPIPAVGISREDGALLRRRAGGGGGKVHLNVEAQTRPARGANLIGRLPGRGGGGAVVLSAHYDGHNCGESALDNATGVAVALELARLLAPCAGRFAHDLEVHFFTAEEWGLQGSRAYADSLSEEEARRVALNLNLDVVAGSSKFTFLCNGLPDLAAWVRGALRGEPSRCEVSEWVAHNSDHASFLRRGIPSVRLLAGLDEVDSDCGFHLSPADTSDKVRRADLTAAAGAAARLLLAALRQEEPPARHRSREEVEPLLARYGFSPPPGA